MDIGFALMVVAGIGAFCFIALLLFMGFIVIRTGDTKGLRDVAVALRAYRVPLPKMPTLPKRR